MKLRIAVVVLALIVAISLSTVGYLYYSLNNSILGESERRASADAEILKSRIDSFLSENLKSVKLLAGLKEVPQALLTPEVGAVDNVNRVLDHFQKALAVDVCYLMDHDGKTIASTNRASSDSFVGKNYSFRPYFQEALQGKPAVYLALGVDSKVPGAYYSYPVYKEGEKSPLGVVVIKSTVRGVEDFFREDPTRIAFLVDPHGIIFLSSNKIYLYRFLWQASADSVAAVEKTLQFGKGPWVASGFEKKDTNGAADRSGNQYFIHQMKIDNYPGWNVVTLSSAHASGR